MEAKKRYWRNKQVVLVSYAEEGSVSGEHLQVRESEFDLESQLLAEGGDVVVENQWVSVDPYLRELFNQSHHGLSLGAFQLDQPIKSLCVSKVVASLNPHFKVGDMVCGFYQVSHYTIVPAGLGLTKIDTTLAQPSHYLGILGMPGLTAWVGLVLIGNPKPGEQVFVTAAAGAVGLLVGQLAKIKGCRVVGSTGSDEKVRLLKEEFGFDEAFNYKAETDWDAARSVTLVQYPTDKFYYKVRLLKEEFGFDEAFNYKAETDWDAALTRYFPEGIDIYFDNVGGRMLEAALNHINLNARIPLCGMISQYNEEWKQRYGVRNLLNLVGKCAKMQGFMMAHYLNRMKEFTEEMAVYVKEGKIKYREDVREGMESFLDAFNSMFRGGNIGKTLIRLSPT